MKWSTRLSGVLAGALVAVSVAAAPAVADEPTVTLVVGVDGAGASRALSTGTVDIVDASGDLGAITVEVPASRAAAAAAALARTDGVRFVEPERRYEAALTPTDTYWSHQWGPRRVGAPTAWDTTTGSTSTVVAVLDTGVDAGPEFDGKLLPGNDFVNDDTDASDDNGHGTSVAAVAAADANDLGVAGMCWTCRILPVKVLGADGSGSSYDIAQGISWATSNGADVIVMSLGGPSSSLVVEQAVSSARAAGVVVVAAAGNAGTTSPTYPAATPGVLGVAGSTETDQRYSWSNHGSWVDVAAPGCNGAPLPSGYGYFCGTSSATPVVGGAIALGLSLGATGTAVEQAITSTAIPVGSWVSAGRIDTAAMIAALASAPVDGGTDGGGTTDGGTTDGGTTDGGTTDGGTTDGGTDGGGTDGDTTDDGGTDDGGTDGSLSVVRASGDDRVATSVALARHAYPQGVDTVVIARADAYADALSAAPLAAALGAPVMLTGATDLAAAVADAVDGLGARSAVLVGGAGALSVEVERDLAALGVADVRRIAGDNRFDTARLIAEEVGGTSAYVVEGVNSSADRGWPDAVAASGLAALQGRPILLTTRGSLPTETTAALRSLGTASVTIVGGTSAVSDDVAGHLSSIATVRRIAGANRYDTSAKLADAAVAAGADGSQVWLATGRGWPDALAAGASAGALGAVLLLVDGTDLSGSPESASWLSRRSSLREVVLVGGPGSLATTVETEVSALG